MEKRCRTGRPAPEEEDYSEEGQEHFFRCARLIFPYLQPSDLASVSSTCKAFRRVSDAITSLRIADASRSFENSPVPFVNAVDSQPYAYFLYTPNQTLPIATGEAQSWGGPDDGAGRVKPDPFLFRVEGARGCECRRSCGDGEGLGCPCWDSGEFPGQECGPSCGCGPECGNRLTQKGVSLGLKIVKDKRKGWSLCAAEMIPKGKFVCEYAGEVVTTEEARARLKLYDEASSTGHFSHALLVVKEHLQSGNICIRMNIDATNIGNIARFINHSCDGGNLCTVIVRSSGALLPRVCFFASRDVQEDEELSFSYGDVRLNPKGSQCFCGTSSCLGFLPSEHT
ncbi:histone-lysine N-methyltransferase SUVR3 isoform X1 [Ipomoea triloba]|uniref:histone-lysine N-methyltransferase SUVR3 isoform X1 n=1 Tax=Ipomoea triloba TaxID=35885 RepID=UPI00125E939F|nr:histone-lysine N-methyltransferase SUVR3 isoform X1 [Ipomoea triloba]